MAQDLASSRPGTSHGESLATLNQALDRAAESAASGRESELGLRILDRRETPSWASWFEVRERSRQVAGSLKALGIAAGEPIALVYPTGFAFFYAFFGTLLAGGVPVPLYPPVRLGRLDEYHRRTGELLGAVEARLVLTDRRVRRLLGEAVARARPRYGCRVLEDLPQGSKEAPAVDVSAADLALVQFSSGTTVEPKPVALSHRAVLSQVRILNGFWPDTPALRHSGVSWLPLYHDMGLIGSVFAALERPACLTLIGPEVFVASPAVWLRTISRYRATISPAPNFAYGLCVAKIRDQELQGVDLSSWRVALNGAETVAPKVLEAFTERFARWGLRREALTPVYGLSEASLAVTFSDPRRPYLVRRFDREALALERCARETANADGMELVSVGRPVEGFQVRVCGVAGGEEPEGRVGRIRVRGPSLMEGYLNRPEATRRAFEAGWLDTGDLGFFYQGELFLTGRAKDLVILRGRNYSPEAIERGVDGVAGVRKGCAVAVSWLPEGREGEELVLFVERRRKGPKADDARLVRECRQRVLGATGLVACQVLVLEPGTLPRTSSGKLRRAETLKLYLQNQLLPPQKMGPLRLAKAMARSSLALHRLDGEGPAGA